MFTRFQGKPQEDNEPAQGEPIRDLREPDHDAVLRPAVGEQRYEDAPPLLDEPGPPASLPTKSAVGDAAVPDNSPPILSTPETDAIPNL